MVFLEFSLSEPENNPIKFWSLIVDLLIYIFLAYLIDISINVVMHMRVLKSEEEKKMIPRMYKDVPQPRFVPPKPVVPAQKPVVPSFSTFPNT